MVYIQAIKKRGILRQLVEGVAVPGGLNLASALLAFQTALYSPSFKQGKILMNTAGNGQSAGFELSLQGKEYTQDAVFGLSEEFFDIFNDTLANNPDLVDDGQEASTRALFAAMVLDDRLQTVNRRGGDFTLLSFPQTGQLSAL